MPSREKSSYAGSAAIIEDAHGAALAGDAPQHSQTTQHADLDNILRGDSTQLPVAGSSRYETQSAEINSDSRGVPISPGSPRATHLSDDPSESSPGSATPKAKGTAELDGDALIQKLYGLTGRFAGSHKHSNLNAVIPRGDAPDHIIHSGGRATNIQHADLYSFHGELEDSDDDGELERHDGTVRVDDGEVSSPADAQLRRTKLLNYIPLRCEYPNVSNKQSIMTLFDLLRVSIPSIPEAYDVDALLETKSVSDAELKLAEEHRLRKIVFLPELVSQLFQKAHKILERFLLDWNDPEVNRFIAKVHPSLTSTSMPVTIWSEEDIVTWSGSVIGRPTMEVIHAVLTNRLDGTHDARRKYPNIASCHHKSPVVPDMGVVRKGNHSKTADLVVTIEMKTQSAYRVKGTDLGKFQDLQRLRSDDQIGRAMKYNWPEGTRNSDNDSQTRMLAQVWAQMVYKKTRLGELTTVESTTLMARGTGSQSDTMFISPAYGCEDCPLLAAFCWHAMATKLFSIKDLNLPDKVDTNWWGREVTQFEGAGVAPASLYTYEKTLTNRQVVLGQH